MRTPLSLARAAAGLLPDWAKAAIYRAPGLSAAVRWLLTRAGPGQPAGGGVAGGRGRGQRPLQREVRPAMTVYDVGAPLGFFTLALARLVGPQGRVLAFEPLPANVLLLRENLAMNPAGAANVQVVEAAVAGESG